MFLTKGKCALLLLPEGFSRTGGVQFFASGGGGDRMTISKPLWTTMGERLRGTSLPDFRGLRGYRLLLPRISGDNVTVGI